MLNAMFKDFCDLYNAALQQRIDAFRRQSKTLRYTDQAAELKDVRLSETNFAQWSFSAEQQVLRRVDKTFNAFFKRKSGFPRFRATERFHAAELRVGQGLSLCKSGKIHIKGIPGEISVRWHRALPARPKSAVVTRRAGKWFVAFHVDVMPEVHRAVGNSVGVDLGLTNIVALSTGETYTRHRWTKEESKGLRRRQRAIARCKRGSKVRAKRVARLAVYRARTANKRRDFCHKLSNGIIKRFDRIAVEDLNIKGLAKGMLAKHVNDAAWAQILFDLRYKAEKAGIEYIKVDPRGTSQICPECGSVAAKTLAERRHVCGCGCILDRDVAAAKVVHFRAFGFWPGTGLRELSEPVAA